jgi:hypothetical protein
MKLYHLISPFCLLGVTLGLTSCATRDASSSANVPLYEGLPDPVYSANDAGSSAPLVTVSSGSESSWPLNLTDGTTNIVVYQPQVDTWDGHLLFARQAVAVQSPSQPRGLYGVLSLEAITLVDKAQHSVTLEQPKILSVDFPSARQEAPAILPVLRAKFPKEIKGLPLEPLEASLTVNSQALSGSGQPLNNTPPLIVTSDKPALLVSIDGPAVYRPVPGTELQRVINTHLLLLRAPSGKQYLRIADHQYLEAPSLKGPWALAAQAPAGAAEAEKLAGPSAPLEPLGEGTNAQPPPLATTTKTTVSTNVVPVVFVETKPAELITFDGPPNFVPIAGTHLLYAANTTANVFKLLTDQRTYVLLAGRWFAAPSLQGPWEYVPGSRLPSDFASIPDTSPKENVKASVPGTTQAAEALIANSIPQSSKIERAAVMPDPQIDGAPQLRPIEGTPLSYVVNSGTPIIKVADTAWYACQNGVWYVATSVNGPWVVASSVPPVIYSIPVTSPLHYLTYVRVYGASPESVYEGYTPGYFGTEVSPDGTVVYGTGYPYSPWIGDDWYGGPATWGYGWDPFWTPWDDWAFGFGFGWGCGFGGYYGWWHCHPPYPGWGPYGHWGHDKGFAGRSYGKERWLNTSGRIYGKPGSRNGMAGSGFARAPLAANYGQAYNSRTGALLTGQRGTVASVASRSQTFGGGQWNSRGFAGRSGGIGWENRSAVNGTFHPGGTFGSPEMSRLPFSSSTREGSARVYGGRSSSSFAGEGLSRGYAGGSVGGHPFSYGGEAFSFSHSGGPMSFSHGTGFNGFSHSGGYGGFSHFGGGGFSRGGGFGGGHGGGFFGGGGHGGGFGGGGHGSGGGGHH